MRARAILAVLLLAITIVGIQATVPTVGWTPPSRGVIIVTGVALEVVLAGLLAALRLGRGASTNDIAERLRAILSRVLVTCLVAIPVGILLTSLRKPSLRPARVSPILRHPGRIRIRLPQSSHGSAVSFGLSLVEHVLIALLLVAVVAVIIVMWRSRAPRLAPVDAVTDEIDTPAEIARAVESGLAALRELDDARGAIISCYLAMEQSLAEAGAARGMAETPDELLARAVSQNLVSAGPAGQLTALFYVARFSSHDLPSSARDQAERALAELAASFPASDHAPAGAARPGEAER
jgi:hypothetical protein